MKKLLTLAVVIATASLAQAATLSWMASQVYQPKENPTDANVAVNGGLVYLFITEQSKEFGAGVTTATAVSDFITSGAELYTDTEGKKYLKKGDDKIGIAAQGATNTAGGFSGATGFYGNFGAGDSLTAFAVVFDASTLAEAKNFMVTSTKSASWTSPSGAKTLLFGSQANATWTAVPEPSTAVLALAGLALLLKRRRA